VDESDLLPSANKIYSLIKKAGGKVFIPHVFAYGDSSTEILDGLMKDFKIDGIECYYPRFSKKQTEFLLSYCRKHNLLVSAGSDYHGDGQSHPQPMGTNVRAEQISWLK
jgi:predicted metal-dependent phosphoesterase TrpH